jgi:hypothetical protein
MPIAGTEVPGFGFVDDFSLFCSDLRVLALQLATRDKFATLYGVSWAPAKDHYLIRGRATARSFSKEEFVEVTGRAPEAHIKILGEELGQDPARCPIQVSNTLKSVAAAAGSIDWLMWKGTAASPQVVLHLFQALVQSIACSHLVLTDTLPSELDTLDAVKTSHGRRLLGVSPLASKWAVLGELGWSPFRSAVLLARLMFLGRLFRREEGSFLAVLLDLRLAQLDAPDAPRSFLGSLRHIVSDLGLSAYWASRPFPLKVTWKRVCKAAIHASDLKQWHLWRERSGHDNGRLNVTKKQWGAEPYVSFLNGNSLALRASLRLNVSAAGASKCAATQTFCRFCPWGVAETAQHLMCSCPRFASQRAGLWAKLGVHSPLSLDKSWDIIMTYSDASQTYIEEVAVIFEAITSTPLHGTSGVHQVALSSQDDFESCLADAAAWVHRNPL